MVKIGHESGGGSKEKGSWRSVGISGRVPHKIRTGPLPTVPWSRLRAPLTLEDRIPSLLVLLLLLLAAIQLTVHA